MIMKRLSIIHPERCIGCYSCMFACSREVYGTTSLERTNIWVETRGGIEGYFTQIVCRACVEPPCAKACKFGALTNRKEGGVVFNREKCTGCGECVERCMIKAMRFDEELKIPLVCKYCGICAQFCPHDVIALEEISEARAK